VRLGGRDNVSHSCTKNALTRATGGANGGNRDRKVGPNLKPGTACVCGINGLRRGMHTIQHPPSPAPRAETDLPTHLQAVFRAVGYVNTHQSQVQD